MRKSFIRFITVLMLLVFTQKMGLRLWLHNWYHTEQANEKKDPLSSSEDKSFKCDCIDDFLMPLDETPVFSLHVPTQEFTTIFSIYNPPFSSAERIFCSLKGPPMV
ncbi:hypothetical protein QEG73_03005 [Chitinophagaceae bacterium 26-R-25]|nr:hypothetical protein [Chitinophagaceae bacterium 26-R-25]